MFADLDLSKRLEPAEGHACAQYAESRRRLYPDCGSEWKRLAGTYSVFDGADSPITQTFGLGIFEPATADSLLEIEKFFFDRGAPVHHEVSPLAGVATLDLLCQRGYRPLEISSVMWRAVETGPIRVDPDITVRVIGPEQAKLWTDISTRGWTHEHPELHDFVQEAGLVLTSRSGSVAFLAEFKGEPGAAGALAIHEGVALFAGAATVPELRRRGLQAALLQERMRYAAEQHCDLAMMVAEAGSNSQRNAERQGFRIAYTRLKWKLEPPARTNGGML